MDTPRTMITFRQHNVRFTLRVVGIAIHEGHVLLEQSRGKRHFWSLPGGRAELEESAAQTLVREMREEVGVEATVQRLLYVVEHFFGHEYRRYHTLGLYFLMAFPPDSYLYSERGPFVREEEGRYLTFAWQPIQYLEYLPLYPKFLSGALKSIPATTQHIVHTDN